MAETETTTPEDFRPRAFDFFAETDEHGDDVGTALAIHRPSSDAALFLHGCYEGLAGITLRSEAAPSGPSVSWLAIAPAYLDRLCRPVTAEEARRIHPELFAHLARLGTPRRGVSPDRGDLGTAAAALHLSPRGDA